MRDLECHLDRQVVRALHARAAHNREHVFERTAAGVDVDECVASSVKVELLEERRFVVEHLGLVVDGTRVESGARETAVLPPAVVVGRRCDAPALEDELGLDKHLLALPEDVRFDSSVRYQMHSR